MKYFIKWNENKIFFKTELKRRIGNYWNGIRDEMWVQRYIDVSSYILNFWLEKVEMKHHWENVETIRLASSVFSFVLIMKDGLRYDLFSRLSSAILRPSLTLGFIEAE